MAGLRQSLQFLPAIESTFGAISGSIGNELAFRDQQKSQDLALQQLQQRQNAELQSLEEQAALDRARIAADADEAERKRRSALKRAVSRQRAQFGSSGLTASAGGSSEAVLLGLFEESDDQREERERLDSLRLGAIDQNLANQRRLNLIQRTQLQQRQGLGRVSAFDRYSNFADGAFGFIDVLRG